MSDGVNFFSLQNILNEISKKEEDQELQKEGKNRLEDWGYKVSGESQEKQDHDTVFLNTMKKVEAENAKARGKVMNALEEIINEITKAAGGDKEEVAKIINDILHKFCYSPESFCAKDLQDLIRLFQEALEKLKTYILQQKAAMQDLMHSGAASPASVIAQAYGLIQKDTQQRIL